MKSITLTNAFSLNMLASLAKGTLHYKELSLEAAQNELGNPWESAVGHGDTAAVFSEQLGLTVEAVRKTVAVGAGDRVLVGQYSGPRLPEGCKTLPEGAKIVWVMVTFE